MPEVNVEINGRKYRMACEEGQEAHLGNLAERFNQSIENLKGAFGEIGDNRLTVMAGIAVLDELEEAEKKIAALKADVENLTKVGEELSREAGELEAQYAKKLAETARKVEAVAQAIDETASGQPSPP
jgi:cell division protein ZapA